MLQSNRRLPQRSGSHGNHPASSLGYVGALGLIPVITAVLTPVMGSVAIAMVVATVAGVTFIALLPRGGRSGL